MKTPRVLIVEDESIVAMHIQESLEKCGYEVASVCASGTAAIKKAKSEKPDLVLMDIILRGKVDGIEAASKIHSDFNIPVIFLTAYSDKNTLKRAKAAHPFGYLNKPFKQEDLHTTIQVALNNSKDQRNGTNGAHWEKQVWDSLQIPALLVDSKGKVLKYTNPVKDFLGLSSEQIEGKKWSSILNLFDEMGKSYTIPLSQVLKSKSKVEKYQLIVQREENNQIQAEVLFSPVRDGKKEVKGCLILIHDISEFTMSPDEKRNMLEDLCAKLEGGMGGDGGGFFPGDI